MLDDMIISKLEGLDTESLNDSRVHFQNDQIKKKMANIENKINI